LSQGTGCARNSNWKCGFKLCTLVVHSPVDFNQVLSSWAALAAAAAIWARKKSPWQVDLKRLPWDL
jgi:hypothetical protein